MPSWSTLNTNAQNQCGPQLRTFSVSYNMATAVYTNSSGNDGVGVNYVNSGTATHNQTLYHSHGSASYSTYDNDLGGSVYSGHVMQSQGVVDSFSNCVRGTVDAIEGVTGNQSYNAYVCHTSCHSSCHTSRGRR